mgnify:CR=1 FL=1
MSQVSRALLPSRTCPLVFQGHGAACYVCRFLRHFTLLSVPPPSDTATKAILGALLGGFLSDFCADIKAMCGPLVNASVDAYNRWAVRAQLPAAGRSHGSCSWVTAVCFWLVDHQRPRDTRVGL